jgi:hypothetical protein
MRRGDHLDAAEESLELDALVDQFERKTLAMAHALTHPRKAS